MTRKKITRFTPEQSARLVTFRQEWLAWGTCTDRSDRATAEAAILAMRTRIGVTNKPVFIWCESPATMSLAIYFLKSDRFRSLYDSLRASLGASLRASLRASLCASLGASLYDSLGDSLYASLRASLRASLYDSLGASLHDSLGASLHDSWWGQHDGYWIAFYLFCRDVVGVRYNDQKSADLDLWRDIAKSCCWWCCYENYVLISGRPTVCRLDDRELLHCQDGPALAFADGWAVHAWHGTRVPGAWIDDPSALTPQLALSEANVERRRAACEILGWNRILGELNARVIDADPDPEIGELLRVDLPDAPGEQFLRVRCGTGRVFVLPVPPTMRTALESNAWTYDMPADLLKLKEQRT